MSKSNTLKIKRLFKHKSPDKENEVDAEGKRYAGSQSPRDEAVAPGSPRPDLPPTPLAAPVPVGGFQDAEQRTGSTLKRMLTFKKKKKSKRGEASDLFLHDTVESESKSQL